MIHDSNYKSVGLGLSIGQKKQFKYLTLDWDWNFAEHLQIFLAQQLIY